MPQSVYPLTSFKFWVEIGGIAEAYFTECSGLSVEMTTEDVYEGGENTYVHKMLNQPKYPNLVLKRGLTTSDELWTWFKKTLEYKPDRRNISIILYDSTGKEAKRWNFREACPVKWTGPDFQANSPQITFESIEIVHQGMEL